MENIISRTAQIRAIKMGTVVPIGDTIKTMGGKTRTDINSRKCRPPKKFDFCVLIPYDPDPYVPDRLF